MRTPKNNIQIEENVESHCLDSSDELTIRVLLAQVFIDIRISNFVEINSSPNSSNI